MSLKMAPFDRSCTTYYWSAIVTTALYCTGQCYLAWWGFTNAADRNRRAVRHGYCAHTTPTYSSLCDKADNIVW